MLIFVLISIAIFPDNDQALMFAEKFYADGLYDQAITEYKRHLFLRPDSPHASKLFQRIARIYRDHQQWAAAVENYRQAIAYENNDSIQAELEIDLAITYLAAENYSAAEFQLIKTSVYNANKNIRQRALLFLGIAAMYSNKWNDAEEYFNDYFKLSPESDINSKFDSLFKAARKKRSRSPILAMWLSTLIPGSGQLYVGDHGNALNAFVLNGIFAYWIGSRLLLKDWGNALLVWHFLARRYYFGNRYHAQRLAEEYNETLEREKIKIILEALE